MQCISYSQSWTPKRRPNLSVKKEEQASPSVQHFTQSCASRLLHPHFLFQWLVTTKKCSPNRVNHVDSAWIQTSFSNIKALKGCSKGLRIKQVTHPPRYTNSSGDARKSKGCHSHRLMSRRLLITISCIIRNQTTPWRIRRRQIVPGAVSVTSDI
jgi:hypothetical protein